MRTLSEAQLTALGSLALEAGSAILVVTSHPEVRMSAEELRELIARHPRLQAIVTQAKNRDEREPAYLMARYRVAVMKLEADGDPETLKLRQIIADADARERTAAASRPMIAP